jgi:hypothetical protein
MALFSIFFLFIIKALIKERPIGLSPHGLTQGRAGTAKPLFWL